MFMLCCYLPNYVMQSRCDIIDLPIYVMRRRLYLAVDVTIIFSTLATCAAQKMIPASATTATPRVPAEVLSLPIPSTAASHAAHW
jgi:hypothetical protein